MAEQDAGKEKQEGDAEGQNTEDAAGADKGQDSGDVTFSEAQQGKLDTIIGERLQRAREKWEAEAETAKKKAIEQAEATRLEEQKEFQKLAEQRAAKVVELEGQVEQAASLQADLDRYKGALKQYVAAAREGLPDHLTPLLDALDPVAQLEYLTANAEALGQVVTGPPPTPKPKGDGQLDDTTRRKRAARTARF